MLEYNPKEPFQTKASDIRSELKINKQQQQIFHTVFKTIKTLNSRI